MRRALSFTCEGAVLAATIDLPASLSLSKGCPSSGLGPEEGQSFDKLSQADVCSGLLIISGGNEIRSGAHRGMAELASSIAEKGYPVLRFDRRGIGDSEGENKGFRFSGPDIAAALDAFRTQCPQLTRIVAFGNCDAATALALHGTPVDARVLANPWVIAPTGDMPPPAAIRHRYARRLRDPEAWKALLTGKVDMTKLAKGLGRLAAAKPAAPDSLADKTVRALEASTIPTTIVLATGDATAIAFADVWRNDPAIAVERIETASHSFADAAGYARLVTVLESVLEDTTPLG